MVSYEEADYLEVMEQALITLENLLDTMKDTMEKGESNGEQ